ncbi:hypothetical protein Pelo_13309 [Pelomyxa schiedti]|nr:hypothetical protein Pelo_13309 [Pelomyxa schiedti]
MLRPFLNHISETCRFSSISFEKQHLLSDIVIQKILENSRSSLTSLCISRCQNVTARIFQSLKNCPKLRRLDFRAPDMLLTDDIVTSLRCLNKLSLAWVHLTDTFVQELFYTCNGLTNLDLSFTSGVSSMAFQDVIIPHCHIEVLFLRHCDWVCDNTALALLHSLPLLRRLNLSHCGNITDHLIELLVFMCGDSSSRQSNRGAWLTKLRELNLQQTPAAHTAKNLTQELRSLRPLLNLCL